MSLVAWIIVAVIWICGAIGAYNLFVKNWKNAKWENIMISLSWPAMIPLYAIYLIHRFF